MKFLQTVLVMIGAMIVLLFLMGFLIDDPIWVINISMFGAVGAGVIYSFWQRHLLQKRVEKIVEQARQNQ